MMPARNACLPRLLFAAMLLCSSVANAQLFRAYLAIDGNDANPCTLPAPCRLLPAALAAVASGGEIWMLDSANYNTATVNITKSVKILAVPGAVGSVLAVGGPAFDIATAGVSVSIRNLVIVPLPGSGSTWGVLMSAGDSLTVEGSLLAGLPSGGILLTGSSTLKVVDTTIRVSGNGVDARNGARATVTRCVVSASGNAINAHGALAGTTTTVSIAGSTLEGSWVGAVADASNPAAAVQLVVHDSQVDRNTYGLIAQALAGSAISLSASNNVITNSAYQGVFVFGTGAKGWVSGNTVTYNEVGMTYGAGGILESAGNNAVRNNGTDGAATVVPMM